ncbi:MAG: hypothetical protein KF894_14085 [Labilithrix sp.]|nr:hypothetical protein [Labilithrix sp.]
MEERRVEEDALAPPAADERDASGGARAEREIEDVGAERVPLQVEPRRERHERRVEVNAGLEALGEAEARRDVR